jgi:hypothetical protein
MARLGGGVLLGLSVLVGGAQGIRKLTSGPPAAADSAPVLQQGMSHESPEAALPVDKWMDDAQDIIPGVPGTLFSVGQGRTELGNSIYAVRTGDTITVHFDLLMLRTRRADKLTRTIRRTLPQIVAVSDTSALDALAIPAPDVLTVLPVQGLVIGLSPDAEAWVLPVVRPARGGPLVVAYRTTLRRRSD